MDWKVDEEDKIRFMLAAMGWLLWVLVLGIAKRRRSIRSDITVQLQKMRPWWL